MRHRSSDSLLILIPTLVVVISISTAFGQTMSDVNSEQAVSELGTVGLIVVAFLGSAVLCYKIWSDNQKFKRDGASRSGLDSNNYSATADALKTAYSSGALDERTSNLNKELQEHKQGNIDSFAKRDKEFADFRVHIDNKLDSIFNRINDLATKLKS